MNTILRDAQTDNQTCLHNKRKNVRTIDSDTVTTRCAICEKRVGIIPFKGQKICRACIQELQEA